MDLFNKKLLHELKDKIVNLENELWVKYNHIKELEANLKDYEIYKNEIQNLLLDNQNLNLSKAPKIKEHIRENSFRHEFRFVFNSKNEDAIKAINEYLKYLVNKNTITNFLFDDIVPYEKTFEIKKKNSISSKQKIQQYYSKAIHGTSNIEIEEIADGIKVKENKINYIYFVESKINIKDIRRDILQFDFEDYYESSNTEKFVKVDDINHMDGALHFFSVVKSLKVEMHEKNKKRNRDIVKSLSSR